MAQMKWKQGEGGKVKDLIFPTLEKVSVLYNRDRAIDLAPEDKIVRTGYNSFINVFDNGDISPIGTLKGNRYKEIGHKFILQQAEDTMASLGLNAELRSLNTDRIWSTIDADFLIDKPFTSEEVPWELTSIDQPEYDKKNKTKEDTYYPMVRVVNSFTGGSNVSFNLYRSRCENGMLFGVILNQKISFRHFGDVQKEVIDKTHEFIGDIFEKRMINNIFEKYESKEIPTRDFTKFIDVSLGKRAKTIVEENQIFNLSGKKVISMWVAWNILTYITSHLTRSRSRELYAHTKFRELLKENE